MTLAATRVFCAMVEWGWSILSSAGNPNNSATIRPSSLDGLIFKLLIRTCRRQDAIWVRPWWRRIYSNFVSRRRVVQVTIHGRKVLACFGYTYPLIARIHPTFNAPLLELVHEVYR